MKIYTFINFDRNYAVDKRSQIVGTEPEIPYLNFDNKVTIAKAGTGDNAYIYGGPLTNNKEIRGTIPKGKSSFRIKGAIPDPPYFFAYSLKSALEEIGIYSDRILREEVRIDGLKEITHIFSPSLERIAYMSNIESNNLYAESLFKTMAKVKYGSDRTKLSIQLIKEIASSYSIDPDQFKAVDGSGLSRLNKISSAFMAKYLCKISKDVGLQDLLKLMGRPGKGGTLENIHFNKAISNDIWIKTGSMGSVQSYSGFIKSKSDNWYSFCIMANDFNVRNSQIRSKFNDFLEDLHEEL